MGCGGSKAAVADSSPELHSAHRRGPPEPLPSAKGKKHAQDQKALLAASHGHLDAVKPLTGARCQPVCRVKLLARCQASALSSRLHFVYCAEP